MGPANLLFEVEEAIEDDQDDDFPEQGMVTLILKDQSTMMIAAIKEMIARRFAPLQQKFLYDWSCYRL